MLRDEPFDRAVAARLLDFFGAETTWQRRLWDVGTCLTLREVLEAADAVAERALSQEAAGWLRQSVLALAGPDLGIGTAAERATLTEHLTSDITKGSFAARVVEQILHSASRDYLARWANAVEAEPPPVAAERLARVVAGHLLGVGLSHEYLHRWWSYRINHEPGARTLSDLLRDAHDAAAAPRRDHDVIVPLRRATTRVHEVPGWLPPPDASELLTPINRAPIAGLAGALRLEVAAADPAAATEAAAEIIDRYVARITLGGGGEGLDPLPFVWVAAGGPHRRMRLRRRRGVEVPVLLHRDEPITNPVAPSIDASLELLGPLDQGSTATAAAGGWAAVETLMSAPGDRSKVHAADRLAALVACSFPRAELAQLALGFVDHNAATNPALAEQLAVAATNTERAQRLARYLSDGELSFIDPSDAAACRRMKTLIARPRTVLRDIETHLQRSLRRLYRVRNLVLHGGATEALTLTPGLRAAAPLVAAGIDRIVRGTVLHNVAPLDLAAKARVMIDNADNLEAAHLGDLLQLAEA